MRPLKKFIVKVTQLKISHPFLKVFVQNARNKFVARLGELQQLYDAEPCRDVKLGEIYIACLTDTKFERCRVIQLNKAEENASVLFIDCGYHGVMPFSQLRLLKADSDFHDASPFCKEFVLAGVILVPYKSYKEKLMALHDLIIDQQLSMELLTEAEGSVFVDFKMGDSSISRDLIRTDYNLSKVLKQVALDTQVAKFVSLKRERDLQIKEQGYGPSTLTESPESKARVTPQVTKSGSEYMVRISAFDEGPFSFFVQLTSRDHEYQKFQVDLQSLKNGMKRLSAIPSPGTICLALIKEHLYRVTIVNSEERLKRNNAVVQSLENGMKSIVHLKCLYEIPSIVCGELAFAKQFKLFGYEKGCVGHLLKSEVNFYFQHITKNKLLKLEVVSDLGQIATCNLFDKDEDILQKIHRWQPHSPRYPPQEKLSESVYQVFISSTKSPNWFHVQLDDAAKITQYKNLLESLRVYDPIPLRNPKVNDACVAKLDNFQMRALVIGKVTSQILKVRFVDIGYEEDLEMSEVKVMLKEFMKLPPFAFRCCLKGFEDVVHVKEAIAHKFENVCKNLKDFKIRVVKKTGELHVVELADSADDNINRRMLELEKDKANHSDWTEKPTPSHVHFKKRGPAYDAMMSFQESPDKSKDWDESVAELRNSTIKELMLDWDDTPDRPSKEIQAKDPSEIWTSHQSCFYQQKTPPDWDEKAGSQPEIKKAVKLPDWGEPGPSSKVNSQESLATSSGVSSSNENFSKVKRESVRITAVANLMDFTMQKLSVVEAYEAFRKELQEVAKAQAPSTDFSVGSFCLALNSLDNLWCRSIMLDVDLSDFCVTVKCLDDGSTFTILDRSQLKSSSINLVFNSYFGMNCSLPIRYNMKREDELTARLMDMRNDNLSFQLIVEHKSGNNKTVNFIELFHEGKNVSDMFVDMGCAKRLVIVSSGPAYINHVVNMKEFSIHMESDGDAFRNIISYTSKYRRREVPNPREGMLVLGFYKMENAWYRSRIISKESAGFKVDLIDYGHEAVVQEIGTIDDLTIADLHPMATKCSLVTPIGMKVFSEDAEKQFKKISDKKEVQVVMAKPGYDLVFVDIFYDGVNIIEKLMPLQARMFAPILHVNKSTTDSEDDF